MVQQWTPQLRYSWGKSLEIGEICAYSKFNDKLNLKIMIKIPYIERCSYQVSLLLPKSFFAKKKCYSFTYEAFKAGITQM